MKRHKTQPKNGDRDMDRRAGIADLIMEFEDWQQTVLPALREDLRKGMGDEALRQKYAAIVQARLISLAAGSTNETAAIAASKDILDRTHGRATEKKEISHRLGKLPEEQLDALLLSALDETAEEDLVPLDESSDEEK